jgi:hypothetical protein
MDTDSERLLRVVERILSDPEWRQAEQIDKRRRLREFEWRLMRWDGLSEDLPAAQYKM